ncbi:hypothetical protein DYB35_004571 [Aphanomyces astaci]|nr:hypothetical protein DYB35_004571 [Aphanomyces astaci]
MMLPSVPSLDSAAVAVHQDASKGRYVVATTTYQAGDIVFQDQAFVYASCSGEHLLNGARNPPTMATLLDPACDTVDEFHPSMHRLFGSLLATMRSLDVIGEVDRAKCILKCVTKFLQHPASLNDMLSLSAATANAPACVDTAQKLLQKFPAVFTQVTVPVLSKIIGILNTNSHELEAVVGGGTGLFLSACLMEHNCFANCSFTTKNNTLWVTAVRPIQVNEPLSIDYGNLFYRPLHERQQHLQQGY